jgi:MFS superfamily sulfate permease-like transporter
VFDLTYGVLGGVVVTIIVNAKNFKLGLKVSTENNVVKASGALFFANANKLFVIIEKQSQSENVITLDVSEITRIDQTALEKLANISKKLRAQDKQLAIVGANERTQKRIDKFIKVL